MITQEDTQVLTTNKPLAEGLTTGKHVLLVEDDRSLRRYLEVIIERAGYDVLSAEDGLEAMKILLTAQVDIVVTDAMMPNLNGHELCRFLRSSAQFSQIPIVLLSALEQTEATRDSQTVNAFLAKPISAPELIRCLAELTSGC